MRRILLVVFLLTIYPRVKRNSVSATNITTIYADKPNVNNEKFQVDFINQINQNVALMAQNILNELLHELQGQTKYAKYRAEFQAIQENPKLEKKIVFLKQLLDMKLVENVRNLESFYTLRNLNFLLKLEKQLRQMQDESAKEMRNLRWYNLCQQFWFRLDSNNNNNNNRNKNNNNKLPALLPDNPYLMVARLVPLAVATATSSQTPSLTIDAATFGRELYQNISEFGSELIDDYLFPVRQVVQDIIEEKPENDASIEKLSKLLKEIDHMLEADDLYEKRVRLYDYLESSLVSDYEQLRDIGHAEKDLSSIVNKLKKMGIDLFVNFIFSNFEFLERLHKVWLSLLPTQGTRKDYDADSRIFFDIHTSYVEFKKDFEAEAKYDSYMKLTKELYDRTEKAGKDMRIFEMLFAASQNTGGVSLNMIKHKCDDI